MVVASSRPSFTAPWSMVGWYPVGKYPSFPPAFAKMSTPLVESLPLWPKGASGIIPPLPSPEMLDKDIQRHQRCAAQAAGAGWHWVVAVQIVTSIFTLGGLIFVSVASCLLPSPLLVSMASGPKYEGICGARL